MATVQYSSAYNYGSGVITARTDTSFTYKRANNSNWHSGRVNITGLIAGHLYSITVNTNRTNNSLNLAIIGTTEDSNNGYFNCKDFGTGHFSSSTSYTVQVIPIGDTLTLDFIQHGGSSFYEFTFSNFIVEDITKFTLKENLDSIRTKLNFDSKIVNSIINHTQLLYTPIEYIQSTGIQCINTNYILQANDTVEFKGVLYTTDVAYSSLFGYTQANRYVDNNWVVFTRFTNENKLVAGRTGAETSLSNIIYNENVTLTFKGNNLKLKSQTREYNYTVGGTANACTGYCGIFTKNVYNGAGGFTQDSNYLAKARLYSFKIYNSDNELVRDFIPVKRLSDNKICLYDNITNTFFENQGTGEFIAGGEV